MNIEPLITIAIPIYNAEKHLKESIQSVLNQTYSNFELLLMNDGSSDNSMDIIRSFNDSRITIIDDKTNRGLIYRLNQSIEMARGEYYARMDADDIMLPSRIESQLLYMQKHPTVDVVGSSIITIDDDNNIVGSGYYNGSVEVFVHPTVMAKTSWFKQNKYSDWAHRAEDTELWLRTSKSSCFWSLEEPLLFYREFGVPTKKKYIESMKTLLHLYSRYKQYGKSFMWFSKNTILTYVKIFLYICFDFIGCTDYLIKHRQRKSVPVNMLLSDEDLYRSIHPEDGGIVVQLLDNEEK